ncbi:hypothetical protein G6F68_009311 [Rhizopus microsporus]|nr:hypothetical protein G6F68_009311 [Rhizopus microsporus]
MNCGDNSSIPTFRRNDEITSTIDYIFISNHLRTAIQSTDIHRLHSSWTDHQLLSLSINLGSTPTVEATSTANCRTSTTIIVPPGSMGSPQVGDTQVYSLFCGGLFELALKVSQITTA